MGKKLQSCTHLAAVAAAAAVPVLDMDDTVGPVAVAAAGVTIDLRLMAQHVLLQLHPCLDKLVVHLVVIMTGKVVVVLRETRQIFQL